MSSEIMMCRVEGPAVEEIKDLVDNKYAARNRWAGVKLECCKEMPDEPFRKLYFDMKTGWGATSDDPRTLHSLEQALEILEQDNFIQYIVYIPDDQDDAGQVAEMNRWLCPIEMKVCSQPTCWEIENVDVINYDSLGKLSEDMEPMDFLAYIVELSYEIDQVVTLRSFDIPGMAWLINEFFHMPPKKYSEEWIGEKVAAAMGGRDRIILCDKDGCKTMFSKETTERFGGSPDETHYVIERFGRY